MRRCTENERERTKKKDAGATMSGTQVLTLQAIWLSVYMETHCHAHYYVHTSITSVTVAKGQGLYLVEAEI